MRCIFCKQDSSDSRSVEHIIPESIGNKLHVLHPGIVCDKCNNYIAREVEKPFLEHDTIRLLRFEEGILSKKGRIPSIDGLFIGEQSMLPISIHRPLEYPGRIEFNEPWSLEVGEDIAPLLNDFGTKSKIIAPKFDISMPFPNGAILSRFLGKVALEVLAFKLSDYAEGIDYIAHESQLDDIRNHVRLGTNPHWPCNVRKIYDKNIPMQDKKTGELFQTMNEFDILCTEYHEYYLVLAIFGIELVINIGGAEIEGYLHWLKKHDGISPLYENWKKEI